MPPQSHDGDSWEYRGPRRDGIPPYVLVLAFGGVGLLVVVLLVLSTTGFGFLGGGDEESASPPGVDPSAYVENNISMRIVTRDYPAGAQGRVTLEVVVYLDNKGQRTLNSAEAVISPQLGAQGLTVQPRQITAISPSQPLGPGEQQSFTVTFPGLQLKQSADFNVVVELLNPSLGEP